MDLKRKLDCIEDEGGDAGPLLFGDMKREVLALENGISTALVPVKDGKNSEEEDDFHLSDAWKSLENIAKNEVGVGKKRLSIKFRPKREKKPVYEKIIVALNVQADSTGFSDEQLIMIWKVVTHSKCKLNCLQRRMMLYSMVPKRQVGTRVFQEIVGWLANSSKGSGIKASVITCVYQLLSFYIQYYLVDLRKVMNANLVSQILAAPNDPFVIPWKMLLLRYILHPGSLTQNHVVDIGKLLKIRGLKRTHKSDISITLKTCAELVLVEDETQIDGSFRPLKLPEGAKVRFCNAMDRLTASYNLSKLDNAIARKSQVFRGFVPCSKGPEDNQRTAFEEMLYHLLTEEGTIALAENPVLMQTFENWLRILFYYQYNSMAGLAKSGVLNYAFLVGRCITITETLNTGIGVVSDWVGRCLYTWDLKLFKHAILGFIPFMEPKHIRSNQREWILEYLPERFTHAEDEGVFHAFVSLCQAWLEKYKNAKILEKKEEYKEAMIWTLSLLKAFVISLVSKPNVLAETEPMLIYSIGWSYKNLVRNAFELDDPDLQKNFGAVPMQLYELVILSAHPDSMTVLTELLNNEKSLNEGESVLMNDCDTKANIIAGAFAGILGSSISGLVAIEPFAPIKEEFQSFRDNIEDMIDTDDWFNSWNWTSESVPLLKSNVSLPD